MQVSVIIPVYNAATFVREAVASAYAQPETQEVILIEDGSSDNSLAVCKELAEADARTLLITHAEGNAGASTSRNVGIRAARFPWVAFLDADDFYLNARFARAKEVLSRYTDADGVHEPVGTFYTNPDLRAEHLARTHSEVTAVRDNPAPEHLFALLASGRKGHIHLNGLVIRREAIEHADIWFDPELIQCQDSDWMLRLARRLSLYSGSETPVAQRRVHAQNRVLNKPKRIRYQRRYLLKCMRAGFYGSKNKKANAFIVARYVSWSGGGWMRRLGGLSKPVIMGCTGIYLMLHPGILNKVLA